MSLQDKTVKELLDTVYFALELLQQKNPTDAEIALGDFIVTIDPDENPALVIDGNLDLSAVRNVILIMEYGFTPRTQNA